jgi:carbon-monoxide dehydrogenase medium subunit
MTNTRVVTQEFEYFTPDTISEVLQLLNEHGQAAKIIAGGTDVVPQLKYEKISPAYLINIMKISELIYIKEDNGLRIGASARLRDVKQYCAKRKQYTSLADALGSIGKVQVMNMGTLGGNLCTASPAADSAPALLVLKSRLKLLNEEGERTVKLEDFFTGPSETVMAFNEIMTEIQVPPIQAGMGDAFIKIARVAADISKISCAVAVERNGDVCASCRIAMGAVASVPLRIQAAEEFVNGQRINDSLLDEAGKVVSAEIKPLTDVRSTETYRKHVAGALFKDTFQKAWKRAAGGTG